MEQGAEALNLAEVLALLRRRALLIFGCTLVVAAAAFAFSKVQTKEYTATSSLIFHSDPLSQQIAGLPVSTSTNQFVEQASNIELVGLGDVAAKTAEELGHGLTEAEVRKSIGIAGQGESSVVAVSATSTSPVLAAKIATVYTHQFVKEQRRAKGKFFASALALVDKQLRELPPGQRFGNAAVALQNRVQTLKLLQKLRADNVSVAQDAPVPSAPSSPQTKKNTVIGGILGLLIGIGLAFVLERFRRERRIVDGDDLEKTYEAPLLGSVPEGRPGSTAEIFRLIRARLLFASQDRQVRTILLTSAERDAGRTTVSRGLAEAAASMGARTLLLEADLRSPTLGWELSLRAGPDLREALTNGTLAQETIQTVGVVSYPGNHTATFDVLPSGTSPALGLLALTESQEMKLLLADLRSKYDLVVIDAPPLTAASDAFPLLSQVDGVVVVGWIGRARRDAANRLREILQSSPAILLGTIANGTQAIDLHSYGGLPRQEATLNQDTAQSSAAAAAETRV